MKYAIETIDGRDYIIIRDGGDIHQIDMQAVSTWGVLLGLTDTAEILDIIFRETNSTQNADWEAVYGVLNENLTATSLSGVPAPFVEDLLDPAAKSPVPGPKKVAKLKGIREDEVSRIRNNKAKPLDSTFLKNLSGELNTKHGTKIQEERVAFIDALAPVVQVMPQVSAINEEKPSV